MTTPKTVATEAGEKRTVIDWWVRLLLNPHLLWILIPLLWLYYDVLCVVSIRISPETTYLTAPLTADGRRIDYFQGLEKLLYPPGMKTDENGARLIVRAFGAKTGTVAPLDQEETEYRLKQIYEKLGLDPNEKPTMTYLEPEEYFVELEKSGKFLDLVDLEKINPQSPWTAEDCPEMADWLAQYDAALDFAVQAVSKPYYCYPVTQKAEDDSILFSGLFSDEWSRPFAQGLAARARNRIATGDLDGAIDDIIVIYRLGRLAGHQGFSFGGLIGISIEQIALSIEITGNPKHTPSAEQIARFRKELAALPPRVTIGDCMEAERYSILDSLQAIAKNGTIPDIGPTTPDIFRNVHIYNWNVILRQANNDFDVIQGKASGPGTDPFQSESIRPWMLLTRYTRSLELYRARLYPALMPFPQMSREVFRKLECADHLRDIILAMYEYQLDHGTLPPAFTVDADGEPLHSWRVLLLPYLGEAALYKMIRLDEPWNSTYNKQFHDRSLPVFQCPTHENVGGPPQPGRTAYSVILGDETPFDATGKGKPYPAKRDTILVIETLHDRNWMEPDDLTLDDAMKKPSGPVLHGAVGAGSFHGGEGMNVGQANGGVIFLDATTLSDEEWREKMTNGK